MDAAVPRLGRCWGSIHNEGVAPYFCGFPWVRVSRFCPPVAPHARGRTLRHTRGGDIYALRGPHCSKSRHHEEQDEIGEKEKKQTRQRLAVSISGPLPTPQSRESKKQGAAEKAAGLSRDAGTGRRQPYKVHTYAARRERNRRIRRRHHAPGQDSDYATTTTERRRKDRRMPHGGESPHHPETVIPGRLGRRPRVAESLTSSIPRERINTDGRDRTTHDRRDRYVSGVQSSH